MRATTVEELIKREKEDEENKKFKVWVCPSIVYNEHITPNKWEQGILYDKNINEFFLQKEVKKAYYEMFENSNVLCIIWDNGI